MYHVIYCIIIRLECTRGESCKYSMGQKNGLLAFSYNNSAESEPIWLKFGTLWARYWGLILANFGRDPRSSSILRESIFCPVNNEQFHRFPVEIFYDILTQQRQLVSPWKLSEHNFKNFTLRGLFFQKMF